MYFSVPDYRHDELVDTHIKWSWNGFTHIKSNYRDLWAIPDIHWLRNKVDFLICVTKSSVGNISNTMGHEMVSLISSYLQFFRDIHFIFQIGQQ